MPYFISLLNYVQRRTENKSRNKISTDQILINVIIFLFCEDKNSVIKYYHFLYVIFYNCCSIFYLLLFSCSFVSDFLWPYGLQHARLPCPSLSPGACSNSCPLNWWCHPTISSSVVPFSSCLLSFLTSGFFPMNLHFASGGQSIGASASAAINIQGWFSLGLTVLISLKSEGLSRVPSNTTVQKHQFFSAQPFLWSNSHIHT